MEKPKRKEKTPWPTRKAMAQIYEKNLWGGAADTFYSGEGSHDPALVFPYVKAVQEFLHRLPRPVRLCDLGCGDFNIGKQLLPFVQEYIALDIVPELIQRNQKTFKADNLSFLALDAAQDELPQADVVLVRQVLQHLCNNEIQQILSKLSQYRYVILTEHLPRGEFEPNLDIISGQGIRLKKGSGVDLLAPPFNFRVRNAQEWVSVIPENGKGVLKTVCYTLI
ncbi:class I SAM-dependent methyltransferase [Sediminicola luteus]|uniref:SAM-dependent methyltransferase n=1 Tax=Sediminicola luteus TaxID=319238 RepID=A0A2A4GBC8_9FLAO|nr:class I SAM-dependent methyltransferase [Sediminicola luteus]PCE65753.1 SAM-dependent methyltransferase [Sediminicola luteus]